ncbi:TetR/AcrR family transcriptional regulator C-terminal domain-containing protein [Streptomyces sp. NBS 14/10]|uniref:TetR/AcrR family transcriptional regulator n=1 Tax=Streptomyces sp. NBS 14/10 TaxID=1945643 RepID=UPI000B7C6299|nr:TetR/AcrR family transcriptional regulator C-terminal domain-containing protein [Streptomyces sp. NBS 14/10]KAK1185677.1 TetR/AcrR family transcriptional regulator C-terminal domain-containing protein [Streptomyces sp. NBS 14/10]NUP40995.1 TetR/AcrR family transcriptional regulator [Streptomyces sp.]
MPRPRSLTHDQLASAALAVIDRDGLAGLSMRAVAKELGMSTMGLYRYVDERDELERLVVEFVLGAVDTEPPPPEAPWGERIEVMVRRLRDTLSAHPTVVPLTVAHRHRSPGVLRWSETVLAILIEAGFEGERRVVALRGLLAYVIGALQLAHLGPLSGDGTVAISALRPTEFPHMAETAREARNVGADQEFFGGLAALLRGLNT